MQDRVAGCCGEFVVGAVAEQDRGGLDFVLVLGVEERGATKVLARVRGGGGVDEERGGRGGVELGGAVEWGAAEFVALFWVYRSVASSPLQQLLHAEGRVTERGEMKG